MPYAITHKVTGENQANLSTYTTDAILVTANKLIIGGFRAGAQPSSISGGGITWTYYNTVEVSTAHLDIYVGVATSPTLQAITINYGSTQNECCWTIVEVDKTIDTTPSDCIIQFSSNTSSSATSITATLPNAFSHSNNITLGILGIFLNGNITAGSGFTELGEANGSGGSIQSQWFQGQDLTVDWTFGSTSGVVAAALEIGDAAIAQSVLSHIYIST